MSTKLLQEREGNTMTDDKRLVKIALFALTCILLVVVGLQVYERIELKRQTAERQKWRSRNSPKQPGQNNAGVSSDGKPKTLADLQQYLNLQQSASRALPRRLSTTLKLTTPAGSVQSMIRAASNMDIEGLSAICAIDGDARDRLESIFNSLPREQRDLFGMPEMLLYAAMSDNRIVHYIMSKRARIIDDTASLEMTVTRESGERGEEQFAFKQMYVKNQWQWKLVISMAEVERILGRFLQ